MREHVMNIRFLRVFFGEGAWTREPATLNARTWMAKGFDFALAWARFISSAHGFFSDFVHARSLDGSGTTLLSGDQWFFVMTAVPWNTKCGNDRVWTREVFVLLAATTLVMSDGAVHHLAFELALWCSGRVRAPRNQCHLRHKHQTSTGVTSRNLRPQSADNRTCPARRRL